MDAPFVISQMPEPGRRLQKFKGDLLTFELTLNRPLSGNGWVRTNIGHADIARREVIRHVENDETPLRKDWFDIPMRRVDDHRFRLTLPLIEVGHFEGKCVFFETGSIDPIWPQGPNTVINVQPSDTCAANIIYNAFVRQFGKNKGAKKTDGVDAGWINILDNHGYTVIPPSGTFRDLIRELDFVMGELGCRIIQLLPINPTPTTFGRMGRFGSPYAALDFTAVDSALAEFDYKTTPLEQFIELVDAVHESNGKLLIDIAVNHTGWAAEIHEKHPEWLVRDEEGRIENPGAWGIVWEDLTKLDYTHRPLWEYVADVFITWCKRGVDGFRCDAGYMIPVEAWTYIISKVREQFPDTLFLLEGLGGKISVCMDLLNQANFNWAYSELFQNYDRRQIEQYLPEAVSISTREGNLIHFAETHDNLRLAATSPAYARMRTALCAFCSINGAFGFANGVEWLATQRIVVHEAHSLNWGASENQVDQIRRINLLLREHPAFHEGTLLKMIQSGEGNFIALVRTHAPTAKKLLILVNLSDNTPVLSQWKTEPGIDNPGLLDLLTGVKFTLRHSNGESSCRLEAGQVLCLTPDYSDISFTGAQRHKLLSIPARVEHQRLQAKVMEILCAFDPLPDFEKIDVHQAIAHLRDDPEGFIQSLNTRSKEPRIVFWDWPSDLHRHVMVPPGHFLLIRCPHPFDAEIEQNGRSIIREKHLICKDGTFMAVFNPGCGENASGETLLKIAAYTEKGPVHDCGKLLPLEAPQTEYLVRRAFDREAVHSMPLMFLDTNGRGGMLRTPVSWGDLYSRYDALLAANLSPNFPEDRRIMFTRCRAWIVFQGYSYEVNDECLHLFFVDDEEKGNWAFHIPVGRGKNIKLTVQASMEDGFNAVHLLFFRHPLENDPDTLEDHQPVRLILRPDIEDRGFHETTKAYMGAENTWPGAVHASSDGFTFSPAHFCSLHMRIQPGRFDPEPEWNYMVFRPIESERGLDPNSDLFSPGYFSSLLQGGEHAALSAVVPDPGSPPTWYESDRKTDFSLPRHHLLHSPVLPGLASAMGGFVVKRDDFSTVIAGYPWFLDWGRDTLIVLRGLISAEPIGSEYRRTLSILRQFARFEQNGTLPNMIRGDNADNRDTSDAPLWFCVACADLLERMGSQNFLEESSDGRTLREALLSIGNAYATRTPNGIAMDPDSGLIFSPSHYTWMDTNYPAATPRQGYPIEIQAMWHAAIRLFSKIDAGHAAEWNRLAEKVRASILGLFKVNGMEYLSDCLHASAGQSAKTAQPDDALRPNQLLAITLGAVDDPVICRKMVKAGQALLVPGAIRSLADRETKYPSPVYHQSGLLNDPHYPYRGFYRGDEDTQRKPAYHNGTAWTWIFPSFSEAYAMTYGEAGRETALAYLSSALTVLNSGCVGHIPEILDGDAPHRQRGCDAQAWGASELYRVWKKLAVTD